MTEQDRCAFERWFNDQHINGNVHHEDRELCRGTWAEAIATLTAKLERAEGVVEAAKELRAAQRDYMADRGNDQKGKVVASAAFAVDEALAAAQLKEQQDD